MEELQANNEIVYDGKSVSEWFRFDRQVKRFARKKYGDYGVQIWEGTAVKITRKTVKKIAETVFEVMEATHGYKDAKNYHDHQPTHLRPKQAPTGRRWRHRFARQAPQPPPHPPSHTTRSYLYPPSPRTREAKERELRRHRRSSAGQEELHETETSWQEVTVYARYGNKRKLEKQKQEALSKAVYLPLRLYFGSAIQIETLRWRDLDRQLTGLLTITQ